MNTTLFFLRSSEQKIAINILSNTNSAHLSVYTEHYGLKNSDVGIYSLTDNDLSGAAWIRLYKEFDGISGYVNDITPVLMLGVLPDVRANGIGTLIMGQLLQEAAVMYDQISVQSTSRTLNFYKRLGFVLLAGSEQDNDFTMIKKLEKKAVIRPTDGYDPRRWMD